MGKEWGEVAKEEEEGVGEEEECKGNILPNLLHIYSFKHNIAFGNTNILRYHIAFSL